MIISIDGEPQALKRHRSFIRGGRVILYDPQTKEKMIFQKKIRYQLFPSDNMTKISHDGIISQLLSKEEYHIKLLFLMPYPRSKLRKKMLPLHEIPHIVKPDLDNLIKFVLDCGNGLLWTDDKKVNYISAEKKYSEEPKTIIQIKI